MDAYADIPGNANRAGIIDEEIEALRSAFCQRAAQAVEERVEVAQVTGVQLQGGGITAGLADLTDDFVGCFAIRVIGKYRVDAALRKAEHGVSPSAATDAGDYGDLSGSLRNHNALRLRDW
jgi:hypothetical protein